MMVDPTLVRRLLANVFAREPGSLRALQGYEDRLEQHARAARMLDRSGRFLRPVERIRGRR